MSSVIISSLPYPARFIRKPRRSSLLVSQSEHYCQKDVVIQSLTGRQAKDVSEITPMKYFVLKLLFSKTCIGCATPSSGVP